MMAGALSTFMDVLVLICLGFTIYYAAKLSNSLNEFKKYRAEFGAVLKELSRNIDMAQGAIENLRKTSSESGRALQEILEESKYLTDELQLMNQAGNSLAKRLEALAEKNSRNVQSSAADLESRYFSDPEPDSDIPSEPYRKPVDPPSFFIQDREYDDESDPDIAALAEDDDLFAESFSRAEQELYEAIRKSRRSSGGG